MTSITYSDAVTDALDRLDDLGYERAGRQDLANHGPRGAEALAALGHPEAIPAWVTGYRNAIAHNDPPGPRFAIDPAEESSWRPALGAFDWVGDWEALFRRELADAPWRDVLVRWWPRLLPGLFSRLTHGPIRTAHAVRSVAATSSPSPQQITELARGLAYWAARFTTLPGQASLGGQRTVAEAVAAAPRAPINPATPPAALLRDGLSSLLDQPGYTDACLREHLLRPDPRYPAAALAVQQRIPRRGKPS
ncbi:questin oxidase family protein [Protofrankia coriariae]|uniref:DUF4243 domain-containing protein n=1 Tax=Protofrankia coriariae TaxID=1562887 RepID=A0ABR5EZZ6_9ACTN|nr:questin oxidase family protein [Protofrankia coriariae]KLL10031.1 hypothetical protein FrCorBMG51_20805 [Protofrankia coriariae]